MLLILGFVVVIVLLNWTLGIIGVKNHTSKSLIFAVIVALTISVCLWFSYKLTLAANFERAIVEANFITSLLSKGDWWREDLKATLQDAIICTVYFAIMLGFTVVVERVSNKWLPVCGSCGERWTFGESLKSFRGFNKGIQCSCCGELQYLSRASRKRLGLLGLVSAPFILSISIFDEMSSVHIIIHLFTLIVVYFSVFPLLLDVQSEDEKDAPMW